MANQYLSQIQTMKQSQVLAPQLRQSLEMLQVPILELRALIEQEIQQNPTVEEDPFDKDTEEAEAEPEERTEEEAEFDAKFEELARLDEEWRDYFKQTQVQHRSRDEEEARRNYFMDSLTQSQSLQEHLLEQLSLSSLEDFDRQIGEMVIGCIDDDGYMTTSLEDLAATASFDLPHLASILTFIQEFDPVGIGARSLQECLLTQVTRLGKGDSVEARIIEFHLKDLGAKKFHDIARAQKITVEEVQSIANFIATLEPKPGRSFSSESTAYVLPEIEIVRDKEKYVVIMNDDQLPHLRISGQYRKLMSDPTTKAEVKSYIRDKIRAADFLIKSIDQRQQTIRNIAEEIIKVQRTFFDEGVSQLKPLTMAEVAAVLGIHETTVSRAIANKYMTTPQGVFEMKYFFTPGFKTRDGTSVSNKTIKDTILNLVADEDTAKPLSDQAMATELANAGIKVARRTIAKYREELQILPSHMRKSF
jgi:RNA polymerase sigma-54 factor